MYKHITIGGIALALILSILALVGGNTQPASIDKTGLEKVLGGSTSDNWSVGGNLSITGTSALTGAATIGSSGTAIAQENYGSCNLLPDATTIAASSTARVTCQGGTDTTGMTALTGITSTSKIVGTLSTTTAAAGIAIGANAFGGLELLGATASTTSGYIETLIINNTGGTYTWPTTGSASGTMQYIGIK